MKKNYYMPLIDGKPGLWDKNSEEILFADNCSASTAKTRETVQRWIFNSTITDEDNGNEADYSIQRVTVEI